ncbi:hypothetical protein [Sinimarinibacterium flocculans]|uniref:Uncharacterized protein n=1 Tax=Sinimarinibacterium flocculans TaxID=985250 RepID=A0A318EFL0_9GAMM|nr:hypothetical protein [Sinimarinibacterium flocculans]PXV71567.1 hypothetical protein C8D93_101619 [Sinimarinibacterium flocculans]
MTPLSDDAVTQFARTFAEAVAAYLTRADGQSVFVTFSIADGVFIWDIDEGGIAGDDVDHLITPDWQRHTGLIDQPLDPKHREFSHERLCKAIVEAVLANGFAARVARPAHAAVLAEMSEAGAPDRSLH